MTKGFYWHVHHNQLFEWCFDEQERRERIRLNKPEDEIETRLRLMKPIIGSSMWRLTVGMLIILFFHLGDMSLR